MAKTTIIIEDTDLDAGLVSTSITTEETALEDGHVTAAHFFGAFLKHKMKDPEFLADVWAYAENIMQNHAGGTITNPEARVGVATIDTAVAATA